MTAEATAIRRGTLEATRVHRDFHVSVDTVGTTGRVDVMGIAASRGLDLLFRPLDGLLGAYYRGPTPGALVTTNRPLTVQRFTAAHELGHHVLAHEPSLDDEDILRRVPFATRSGAALQEVEADAFAATLLLPRWLVSFHCERQGWTDEDLQTPDRVYQLALRTGTSYEATCWILSKYKVIDRATAKRLVGVKPRDIKKRLLGTFEPQSYHGDVWHLTLRDAGSRIEGSAQDIFVFSLTEHSGGGYVWELGELAEGAFDVVGDERRRDIDSDEDCGGPVVRRITAASRSPQSGQVHLTEGRPWQPAEPLHAFVLGYDLAGAEPTGLSRAERRRRLEAAA